MPSEQTTASARGLFLAAALLAVEALAALAFGVASLVATQASRAVVGSGTAIVMLAYGTFLLAVARGVFRGRRWSRAPAVATQLLLLPVAWSFRSGQTTWVFYNLAGLAVVILVALLKPSSTAIFVPAETEDDEIAGRETSTDHEAG